MNIPDGVVEFLFYLAPSVLVFLTSFFLIKKFLDTDQRLKMADMKRVADQQLLPLRLQAYERIVLYLERMSPNNLLIRVFEPGMTVSDFHKAILLTIRSEYEHNITQQVYVTNNAWNIVRNSRDELLKLLNLSLEKCVPNAPGHELSKKVFETMLEQEENPVQKAIDLIKNEAHSLF